MSFKSTSLLCLALFLATSSAIHAFDITKILGQYPDFSTFNKYLTETKLADQINTRNTITVLAVDNGGLGAISGKSPAAIKAIIGTHVVLDYYDEKKLMEAQGGGEQLTTLYQTTGLAVNQQGFIKVALIGEGEIAFGSAVKGASVDAELVRTVKSEPYNISILQVSKPIVFPGADSQTPSGAKAPVASQVTAKAPVASQTAKAPVSSQPPKTAQSAKAPASSGKVDAPSPSVESVAESPEEAVAPEADTTAPSPSLAQAPGPAGADVAADAPAPAHGSSARTQIGLVGAVMGFASLLVVL